MHSILEQIIEYKKGEVERNREAVPLESLKERITRREKSRDFASAIGGDGLKLIAEVKKASPSKGLLCRDFDPVKLATTYARNGAAAISVLTETEYFQGSPDYLSVIREQVGVPLLRKDFIFDEYQVYESAAYGADALLLIMAVLEPSRLEKLLAVSRSLDLDCLVEVHNEVELTAALLAGARVIGINNRDLNTFEVDTDTTRRLRLLIPPENIVVSESGIRTRDDMRKMEECKVNAVLVGEALVTAPDIPAMMRELMT